MEIEVKKKIISQLQVSSQFWYPRATSKQQNARQPGLPREVCVNEAGGRESILNYAEILHYSPKETRLDEQSSFIQYQRTDSPLQ